MMFGKKQAPPDLETPGATPAPKMTAAHEKPEPSAAKFNIYPDAVGYRTEEQVCETCQHMGADGQCGPLAMPVGPKDSCALHSAREDGAGEETGMEMEAPV